MFPLIIGPELQLIREEFTWAQTLQYRHSDIAIWLTVKRASSLSALRDCPCCKWKLGPHTGVRTLRRMGHSFIPGPCKGKWLSSTGGPNSQSSLHRSEQWGKNAPWHHPWWRTMELDGELAGEAGVMGIKEVHAGFRNLWDQQVGPGFYRFQPKAGQHSSKRNRFLILKKIIKIQSWSFGLRMCNISGLIW